MSDQRRVVRYRGKEGGCRTAIVVKETKRKGRILTHLVVIENHGRGGLRYIKEERPWVQPLDRGDQPYPLKRALQMFRRIAKEKGATKAIKQALRGAS